MWCLKELEAAFATGRDVRTAVSGCGFNIDLCFRTHSPIDSDRGAAMLLSFPAVMVPCIRVIFDSAANMQMFYLRDASFMLPLDPPRPL